MCHFEHPKGRHFLSVEKQEFNKALSLVRIAVENAFGSLHNKWTYIAFSKALLGWRNLSQITGQITLRLQPD
jgi:hypothetical protein